MTTTVVNSQLGSLLSICYCYLKKPWVWWHVSWKTMVQYLLFSSSQKPSSICFFICCCIANLSSCEECLCWMSHTWHFSCLPMLDGPHTMTESGNFGLLLLFFTADSNDLIKIHYTSHIRLPSHQPWERDHVRNITFAFNILPHSCWKKHYTKICRAIDKNN